MAVQRDKVITSAEKLVAKGKIEPAIKEYERLLDDNPNDVNTLNRIGDLWVRINRNDEAVKVFGKIADHYGRDGFFLDRKSTRLNSSHLVISYAVFCLKKKKQLNGGLAFRSPCVSSLPSLVARLRRNPGRTPSRPAACRRLCYSAATVASSRSRLAPLP